MRKVGERRLSRRVASCRPSEGRWERTSWHRNNGVSDGRADLHAAMLRWALPPEVRQAEGPQDGTPLVASRLSVLNNSQSSDLWIVKCKQPAVLDDALTEIIVLGLAIEVVAYHPRVCTVSND